MTVCIRGKFGLLAEAQRRLRGVGCTFAMHPPSGLSTPLTPQPQPPPHIRVVDNLPFFREEVVPGVGVGLGLGGGGWGRQLIRFMGLTEPRSKQNFLSLPKTKQPDCKSTRINSANAAPMRTESGARSSRPARIRGSSRMTHQPGCGARRGGDGGRGHLGLGLGLGWGWGHVCFGEWGV